MYDYLIVGAGLFGSVFAQQAAEQGKKVLVIEKRNHIGGNAYSEKIEGINVHKYGAHIFHTDNQEVYEYMSRFCSFNNFINSPLANYKGELYSLPFNMYTFNRLWGVVTPTEAEERIFNEKKEISGKPQNLEQQAIYLVGRDIYEKLIKGYTEKQWGRPCNELPNFIINRIPIRFSFNNNYYESRFQGIPIGGYTRIFEQMLDGIEVKLGEAYQAGKYDAEKIIYTGPIDLYYNYCYGPLQYRSVRFEQEILDGNFQGNAVVNYTDLDVPWTRIIEHKWFEFGKDEAGKEFPKTVISREYSKEWRLGDEPFYPVNDEKNNNLFKKYRELANKEQRVIFGGRLGQYKYYDMDKVVYEALTLVKKEIGS